MYIFIMYLRPNTVHRTDAKRDNKECGYRIVCFIQFGEGS